ncbi:ankyrin repeat-containing domain protein [Mycena galopus ATCC 62051]|nr:ankyrin repeat-containing domain protein [Mycena galopus ATCC 62051]
MALSALPPELVLRIVFFLTRERLLDPYRYLAETGYKSEMEVVPDLSSINAFSQINVIFYRTLNETLYRLCVTTDALGQLALLFAVQHQLESTVDKLAAAGLNLDADFVFKRHPCSILHVAAAMGLRAMVVKLLEIYGEEATARVHARTASFETALDLATRYGHIDVVRLLAPVQSPTAQLSHQHYLTSALFEAMVYAVNAAATEICRYLISEGADVNFLGKNIVGGTPLSYAAEANNLELVQFLLASDADPNLHGHHGLFIPLFIAVRAQNMAMVQALVDGGADIHVQDHQRHNVLPLCRSIELLRFFLERGVDPNAEDDKGYTPLLIVYMNTHDTELAKASVKLLLNFGAAVDKTNLSEQTPVDVAMQCGLSGIVEIMEPLVRDPNLQARITKWRQRKEEKM